MFSNLAYRPTVYKTGVTTCHDAYRKTAQTHVQGAVSQIAKITTFYVCVFGVKNM